MMGAGRGIAACLGALAVVWSAAAAADPPRSLRLERVLEAEADSAEIAALAALSPASVLPSLSGVMRPAGIASDPASGDLFVLDRLTRRIARLAHGGGTPRWLDLRALGEGELRGLAFDESSRRLYTIELEGPTLHELDEAGRPMARRSLAGLDVRDPRALVIAPSGDRTDPPETRSFYVTDGAGAIAELAWSVPAACAPEPFAALAASLVRRTATSAWSPPSPDPSGIAYDPASGRLIVVDGEVEETSRFASRNVWETSLSGTVQRSWNSTSFTSEPVGIAVNRDNGHLFISDDDRRRVFEIDPGADGRAGTSDDRVTSFSTSAFGATDPEGVAYDPAGRRLFVCDGLNDEIYVVRPGSNGIFDGSDDVVSHFDLAGLGIPDPETVEYREDTGTLLVVGKNDRRLTELTTSGALVSRTDLSFTSLSNPAGLAYGPRSNDPSRRSVYIVTRGVDNDQNPDENDGMLVEIGVDGGTGTSSGGVVDRRIAAGNDDAEEQAGGGVNLTSSDIEMVRDGTDQVVGLRFTGLAIPRGAQITRAWIQFETDETPNVSTSLTLRGQAADNAPAFTSATRNVSSRARTTASVSWSPARWAIVGEAGSAQRTPELRPVIQEIVNRGGWSSGNALAIIVTGTGERVAASFNGKPSGAALLHVEFAGGEAEEVAAGGE